MDPALAAVAIVFIIAILILGVTMISGAKSDKSSATTAYAANSYPQQYGGGGCGLN